jgi:hypothetical protein
MRACGNLFARRYFDWFDVAFGRAQTSVKATFPEVIMPSPLLPYRAPTVPSPLPHSPAPCPLPTFIPVLCHFLPLRF